jgi:transmembrane sensor
MWAVDATYGELTPERRADLEAWLAADRRHLGAYLHARASIVAMERAVTAAYPSGQANEESHEPQPVRGRWLRWTGAIAAGGVALAASIAAIVMVGIPAPRPDRPVAVAASQVLHLKDGSVATLQPGARIEFVQADGIRKVTLVAGEASFKVAHDKAHPFVVRSGGVYAQATGTVYSVARVGKSGGTVHVTEGSVLVWSRDERDQAILVHAGETVSLDLGARTLPVEPKAGPASPLPPPALAQISLDKVTIKAAVARFNRVNSTKIIIADPAIAATEIDGFFRANDPERFAEAAAAIAGGQVAREKGKIIIKPRPSPDGNHQ